MFSIVTHKSNITKLTHPFFKNSKQTTQSHNYIESSPTKPTHTPSKNNPQPPLTTDPNHLGHIRTEKVKMAINRPQVTQQPVRPKAGDEEWPPVTQEPLFSSPRIIFRIVSGNSDRLIGPDGIVETHLFGASADNVGNDCCGNWRWEFGYVRFFFNHGCSDGMGIGSACIRKRLIGQSSRDYGIISPPSCAFSEKT